MMTPPAMISLLNRTQLRPRLGILTMACLLSACSLKQAQPSLQISEVKLRSMSAEDFTRISDYLQPEKTAADRLTLRSQADALTGHYFILICSQSLDQLPTGTQLLAKFRLPNKSDLLQFKRALDPIPRPRSREIYVGITGSDWQNNPVAPTAWEFTLQAPDGTPLCRYQSFLWSANASRY